MGRFRAILDKPGVLLFYDTAVVMSLREEYDAADEERRHRLHASLLDEPFCQRRALYAVIGKKHKAPASRLLIFDDGIARHRRWQRRLIKMGWSTRKWTEKTIMLPGLDIRCTPDTILLHENERYIWELKGMAGYRWRAMDKKGVAPENFVKRMHIYAAATGIMKGILHIDNKDTNQYKTFEVTMSKDMIRELYKRAYVLQDVYRRYMKTGKKPPRCNDPKCEVCHAKP